MMRNHYSGAASGRRHRVHACVAGCLRGLLVLLACAVALPVCAQTAKTPDQVKIYINPGHGGWGSADRPMGTLSHPLRATTYVDTLGKRRSANLPDTCGFFESNTDLWKAFGLYHKLAEMGVKKSNMRLSRNVNGPYPYNGVRYDSIISKFTWLIAAEAEAFAPDAFIAIHSDAGDTQYGSTYRLDDHTLFLYRGHDGQGGDLSAGSRDLSLALWGPHMATALSPNSTAEMVNVRGDFDFYGKDIDVTRNHYSGTAYEGYLGVLKHAYPGLLIEGFCHSYAPEAHRALNRGYCEQEGVRIARGLCQYLHLNPETTGDLMGTVKQGNCSLESGNYIYQPGSVDTYAPINGATVTLFKGSTQVATCTTDQNYNGLFVFDHLAPGNDYYLQATATGFKTLREGPFTVTAGATAYPKLYLYQGSGTGNLAASGFTLEAQVQFTDRTIDALTGKTVRRAILRDGSLFVLALDAARAPYIYQINPADGTVTRTISTSGVSGGDFALSDMAITSDGVLLACNQDVTSGSASAGSLRVYKWASLDGQPALWFSSPYCGYWSKATMGQTMVYEGSSTSGRLLVSATNASTRTVTCSMESLNGAAVSIDGRMQVRWQVFTVAGGKPATGTNFYLRQTVNNLANASNFGLDFKAVTSPLKSNALLIDGLRTAPVELQLSATLGANITKSDSLAVNNVTSQGANVIAHGERKLMVSPITRDNSSNQGLCIYDVTGGLATATAVAASGLDLDTLAASQTWADGTSDGSTLTLYLLRDDKLSRFTAVTRPPVGDEVGIFAYDLTSTQAADGTATFSFVSNSDATAASLRFTDAATGSEVGTVALSGVVKGPNTFTFAPRQLPGTEGQSLNWAVTLTGRAITAVSQVAATTGMTRATVAVDNCPQSRWFGRVYVGNWVTRANAANGYYAFTPMLGQQLNSSPFTGGETFVNNLRFAVAPDGQVWLSDWGDSHSGLYVASPLDVAAGTGTVRQFYQGTRASSGLWSNGGTAVGGSTSGISIGGTGSQTRLFVYDEDYAHASGQPYRVNIFNIGQPSGSLATTWATAPSRSVSLPTAQQAQGALTGSADGSFWLCQYRGKGNNSATVPALVHVDRAGTIDFNSGESLTGLNGSLQAAFAVNCDSTLLAVNDGDGVVQVYALAWAGGVPTVAATPVCSFTAAVRDVVNSGSSRVVNAVYALAFDWGGNLLVAGNQVGIYALPIGQNQHTTPARQDLIVAKPAVRSLAALCDPVQSTLGTDYCLDDDLTCVAMITDRLMLVKDQGGYAAPSQPATGQIDYNRHVGVQSGDYDQSNWLLVTLPQAVTAATSPIGHRVSGLSGTLTSQTNPALTATAMPVVGDASPYAPNVYVAPNFAGTQQSAVTGATYFFVTPKPMEYAQVQWLQWNQQSGQFTALPRGAATLGGTANEAGLAGSFPVATTYLAGHEGEEPASLYADGLSYRFTALIAVDASQPSGWLVYPFDYSAGRDISTSVTAPQALPQVVRVACYNTAGQQVPDGTRGVLIRVVTRADGTTQTQKVMNP